MNRASRYSSLTLLAVAIVSVAVQASTNEAIEEYWFEVSLDLKPLGKHRFVVARSADSQTVEIEADFKYRFFGIPVYRYQHRNREVWRDGCLQSISSTTNDNGDQLSVEGQLVAEGFKISTQDQQRLLATQSQCVMTFAYWDQSLLQQSELLNAQTGEILPIEVRFVGLEKLQLPERVASSRRYRLLNETKDIDINVWYEQGNARWLGLQSVVDGDRLIRYQPVSKDLSVKDLPKTPSVNALLGES